MKTVLFRTDIGSKEGQETNKLAKLDEYKKLLESEGKKIISEEPVKNRFGNCIKITYKNGPI